MKHLSTAKSILTYNIPERSMDVANAYWIFAIWLVLSVWAGAYGLFFGATPVTVVATVWGET